MIININLIAERRARKLREMSTLRWSVIGLGVLLLLMVSLNIAQWNDWQSNERDLVTQTDWLKDLQQQQLELQDTVRKINEKGPIVDLLEQVRISEGAWMTILADISQIIPHDAYVASISSLGSRDGMRLRFNGQARDQETVGSFMEAFSQQTRWANPAELASINRDRNTGDGQQWVRFDFSIPVSGLLGGNL